MNNPLLQYSRSLFISAIAVSCSSDSDLSPFTSDGCSLFPDSSLITGSDWCSCCVQHDVAYWRGGTAEEREAADLELRECVLQKTENAALANLMYEGVRVGGSPYFQNWYRWSYGWGFDRTYQALTEAEINLSNKLLDQYFESASAAACPI